MSLKGLSYLVTGSTDGIGRHTATLLARAGATVLVHGRNGERVNQVVDELQKQGGTVQGYVADLASLTEVRRLADQVKTDHPKLNMLINNAGVFEQSRKLSKDGYEMTWAVNVIAPFLLTHLLLDSVTDRILNVASISAGSHIDFDNLQQERGYSSHSAYSLSKLAMQMFTYALARRLEDQRRSVICLTCDPGTVNTKMLLAGWGSCGIQVNDANDEFWLVTSPDVAKCNGQYFVSRSARTSSGTSKDVQLQERLWNILETQSGLVPSTK